MPSLSVKPSKLSNFYITGALLIVITCGFFLRAHELGHHDLWFDEAASVENANNRLSSLYPSSSQATPYKSPFSEQKQPGLYKRVDPQPPTYYTLLYGWMSLFGAGAIALRILSVCAGILAIPLIYITGKALVDQRTGLYAAVLLTFSPMHILYAQEVRGYTLSVLFTLAAFYLFYQAQKIRQTIPWLHCILMMALAFATNYFTLLLLLAGWAYFLIKKDRLLLKQWLAVNITLAAIFSPWLSIFIQHINFVQQAFWIPKPTPASLLITFENFNLGYNADQLAMHSSLLITLPLCALGLYALNKQLRSLLLIFLFLPLGMVFLISQKYPIYIDRHLLLFSPFYYLLIAAGLARLKTTPTKIILLLYFLWGITTSLQNYYNNRMPVHDWLHHLGHPVKKPYQPAIVYIDQNWQAGDLLIHGHICTNPSFYYYINLLHLKPSTSTILHHQRIWLVTSSWNRDGNLEGHTLNLKARIANYYNQQHQTFSHQGLFIDLFALNQDKIKKYIENLPCTTNSGQTTLAFTDDIQLIQKTVTNQFSLLAGQGSGALWPSKTEPNITTAYNHGTNNFPLLYNMNQEAQKSLQLYIFFYVTSLSINHLRITDNTAEGIINCSFETFHKINFNWIPGTCSLKTQFIKQDGVWKIQSWSKMPAPVTH